jgi:hypothetical protein
MMVPAGGVGAGTRACRDHAGRSGGGDYRDDPGRSPARVAAVCAAAEKPGGSRRRPARHARIRWWCVSATRGGTGQDQFERTLHGLLRTGEQQPNVRAMTMAGAR